MVVISQLLTLNSHPSTCFPPSLIGCSSGAHRVLIGCSSDAAYDVNGRE